MPTDTSPSEMPDSRPLFRLIGRTRRLLRSSWILTGLGLSVGLLLGALAAMTLIDLFLPLEPVTLPFYPVVVPLDVVVRCLALFLIVVPASLAFVHGVVRPVFRRLGPTQVARRIESHLPGIHNRLVSAIDLESRRSSGGASPVFLRRLLNEALARIRGFRAFSVVDRAALVRAGVFSAAAAAACVAVALVFADYLPTTLRRIFLPFADIPPASRVAYAVKPGQAEVLREEEIPFTAEVTRGEPTELRLELYGASGVPPRQYDLKADRVDPSVWKMTVDAGSLGKGFENGFRYRVYGGRTWSPEYAITLVDRPVLASMTTAVHMPAYMRLPEPVPTPPDAVEVTGPEGIGAPKPDLAQVEVVVREQGKVLAPGKVEYSVTEGDIQLLEPDVRRIAPERQQERAWFDEKLPVGATSGGTWDWRQLNKQAVHAEAPGVGTRGHWFQGDPAGQVIGKGDVLYAYVRLSPASLPDTLALEWHDGDGWEHRAFWGADRIREGRTGTASRFRVGDVPADLPAAGRWVRLEVPAARVGMEGKTARGMAFKIDGGAAAWGRTGTVQVEEPGVRVVRTYPLHKSADDTWAGKFPLTGKGMFRAELRSRAGHPNKPMKELQYVALPDKAPYVALDRQGVETVLSKAAAIPLNLSAFDDYGVDELTVLYRSTPAAPYQSRTLRRYERPERTVTLVASFDEAGRLGKNEALHYLVEVRDTRGQTARTPEYAVRVADDGNADDKKLEAFDRAQDTFQERLVKLIGEQKKVQAGLEKADKEYAELTEKARAAEKPEPKAGEKEPEKTPADKKPDAPKLSPEDAKRYEELRKELEKLKGEQDRNADAATAIDNDLKSAVTAADKLDLLPKPVLEEMKGTERLFDKMVKEAMRDLSGKLADSKASVPDTKDLKDRGDRIGKELDGLKNRFDALSDARKGLKDDVEKAIAALRDKMLKEDAKITARDLEALRDFLNKLKDEMKAAGERADAEQGSADPADPKKGAARKPETEEDIKALLEKAKKLLAKKSADRPEFPDAPFRDDKEEIVPPREEDGTDPLPMKKEAGEKKPGEKEAGDKTGEKKDGEDEEEPKFMPRLGGPKPKVDPRFAKKMRPVKKGPGEKDKDEDGDEKRGDLDAAEKSLESDANTLEAMIAGLKDPGKEGKEGKPKEGAEGEAGAMARALKEMMESAQTREARMMAAAAKALGKGKGKPNGPKPPGQAPPTPSDEGNRDGSPPPAGEGALAKLDPAARAMILKLPPSRFRDELIQGLGERGPEAYEAFIQDYFKRLTDKTPPK